MIIILILLVIVLIPVIAAAIMPEDFEVSTDITIHRSVSDVFAYTRLLRNSEHYNKWVLQDPAVRKEFVGTDGMPGFVFKWDSDNKNVGKGEQEITTITENEHIGYELRFIKPFQNVCGTALSMKASDNDTTRVTWSFTGKRKFVMRIFHFLFSIEKMMRKDLGTSLHNLKHILEKPTQS